MRVRLKSNAARIAREIGEFPREMLNGVIRATRTENQHTVGYIQKVKLTNANAPYLNVRSGRLRGSIRASRVTVTGQRVSSSIGTNVVYAGVHEYGFKGTVQVGAFTRRIPPGRFGSNSPGGGTENVRAHSRRVNFKARHMIEDGVEDNLQNYANAISAAIEEAWNQ